MRKGDPGWSEARIDEDRFAAEGGWSTRAQETRCENAPKESSRLLPAVTGEVPQTDRVPADGVVWLAFDEFVRQEEQS